MSNYIIETRDLTKRYGNQASVSHLNIHVKKGRIYGLLGRNGAGKTTTMRMLLGLTAPTSGEVTIFGKTFQGNEKKILPRIGCLIESPGFYPNLTGTENLKIFAELRGLKNPNYIKGALELVNLPYRDKKLFSQYSLGMKQRLAIALAVMHDPELLILDEPINGLDPIGIAEVRDFIRELCDARGKTILISSHILSEISLLADDVGIIDHGNLLEEESLKELEAKNAKYIHFCVSDAQKAAQIIAATFRSKDIQLADANNLYLYDTALPVTKINRSFMEAGIDVQEAHLCEDTLEDYYTQIDNRWVQEIAPHGAMNYKYTLAAYDENGNEKDVVFETSRVLTDQAFLCLKVNFIRGVVTWAEVEYEELPAEVQQYYNE